MYYWRILIEFLEAKKDLFELFSFILLNRLNLIRYIINTDCLQLYKLTERTPPKSLSISLLMAPISLSMSLVREELVEEPKEDPRADG